MQTQHVRKAAAGQARIVTIVRTLDELVGAHCETLESMFQRGTPTDPEELGAVPRARFLAVAGLSPVHLMLRPVVRAFSRGSAAVWQGIAFDHGGNAGANRLFSRRTLRFRAEHAPSVVDGAPALVLSYDKLAWPLSSLRDELRSIAPGLALGPTFVGGRVVAWIGVSAS